VAEPDKHVGLFVTCLVDLFRPTVGLAAVKLLEDAGCIVEVPAAQTCCGQPAYNAGDKHNAKDIAKRTIPLFEGFDYVVVPSGSCGGMLKEHYPQLLADEPTWAHRAQRRAACTYELVSFLHDVLKVKQIQATFAGTVAYHDSCSGLRELGIKEQPRTLLRSVAGLTLKELPGAEICCGFGGTFCVKYPEISDNMAAGKAEDIVASGADTLLAGDMGCLMNIAGKLKRDGHRIAVRHVAEVLAGADGPAIGQGTAGERG
jgi:L-lactate dehydrogenase complex protein LldE